MSLYQKIKSAITVRQVGEMYGMGPDRRGMVRCPFHSDSHPSMKLNDTYYYCFGCGANGDAIDLTAKLFDLNPRQAAEKLNDFAFAKQCSPQWGTASDRTVLRQQDGGASPRQVPGLTRTNRPPMPSPCRRLTAAVRVVPADAGRAHRPPCSGKVRLIIYSPEVVGLTVRPTTSLS